MKGRNGFILVLVLLLTACGGGGSGQTAPTASDPSGGSTGTGSGGGSTGGSGGSTNLPPTITGTPAFAQADSLFTFTPTVVDPEGDALTFSAANLPGWLAFDTASGQFSGTPTAADQGVYTDISFTVSDGTNTVTTKYSIVTATNALEEAVLTGDHRFETDESVYVQALYDAIDTGVASSGYGANELAVKTLVKNLENDTFSFDLVSACYGIGRDGNSCTDATYRSEFGNTVSWLKTIFDGYDTAKYDLFAHADAPRYQKLVLLLADHIRSTISLPVSIGNQHDFLRAEFADHLVHVYRDINPAQPDLGNFSRSDFSAITPSSADVNISSRKPFRAAGVYALPGQTLEITRHDAAPVTVKIGINSVRSLAVREFATLDRAGKRGYNRPKYLQSPWIEIDPGETIRITSPYGGPVEVSFDSNDQPVALTFSHIGHHPFWSGPADTATFLAALAADQYDWAEFVTPDFELHTPTNYMQVTLGKPWTGDPDTLYDRIVNSYLYYPLMLAGYQDERIGTIAEVQTFAGNNGLTVTPFDRVQHLNADQAACSSACGGPLIDLDASFDPYGVTTDIHELGHSIEPERRFAGSYLHATTDLYGNYTEYRTRDSGVGAVYGCYSYDYQGLFNLVQASRGDADPGATMRADIQSNDVHGLMVFQQLMAMAQNEGTLADGWDMLPEWQIVEREYDGAVTSDALWAEKAAALGFGTLSRSDAAALSDNDLLLIMLSKVENRDLSAWLEIWGVQLSDTAKTLVGSLGYAEAPLVYYALSNQQSCDTFAAPSVAIDGVSAWPL
ncbi:ImpA family metalloprotease [Gallaecimonas kandeliae]|uniref:ImpA family metalloprotease n=1 Tax=Gallaecimonas kandeliae TaxID=3029055 RepID=UPI002649C81A|nr:ImpA family metalloprotease [Gallaecimonas kandeliae]WKE66338.1 ImpA family metalloprotease [Gallaecimonas kandeliae]